MSEQEPLEPCLCGATPKFMHGCYWEHSGNNPHHCVSAGVERCNDSHDYRVWNAMIRELRASVIASTAKPIIEAIHGLPGEPTEHAPGTVTDTTLRDRIEAAVNASPGAVLPEPKPEWHGRTCVDCGNWLRNGVNSLDAPAYRRKCCIPPNEPACPAFVEGENET